MIIGFGNNVVSALAADITANQTTIQVMPGTGERFADLLTYDYANSSNTLQTYAKITLTDARETVFEVCHLLSVNNDVLTVERAQEGTEAKGWSLNDVIANFATRGSENQFVQIEQLQSGHYTAAVAGGTANALTLELPATYFLNDSTEWALRAPVIVYPSLNNTGASTLQLTMGGRVLGTFPLYKGNKAALVANDILKDVALVCLMDSTKTFFNVANPGAIYAGLGTAAFRDAQTSVTDATAGRLMQVGAFGVGATSTTKLEDCNASVPGGFYYGFGNGTASPTLNCPPDAGNSTLTFFVSSGNSVTHFICLENTSSGVNAWFGERFSGQIKWTRAYTTLYKPTATDTGALPITGGILTGQLGIDNADFINKNGYTTYTDGDGNIHHQVGGLRLTVAGDILSEIYYNETVGQNAELSLHNKYGTTDSYLSFRNDGLLNLSGSNPMINFSNGTIFATDGNVKGAAWGGDYLNIWINNNYAKKSTSSLQPSGWFRDESTGFITQWGIVNRVANTTPVLFPISFPSTCVNVQLTLRNSNAGGSNDNIFANSEDANGFQYRSSSNEIQAFWMAIGY